MKKQKVLQFAMMLVLFFLGIFYYVTIYASRSGTFSVMLDTGGTATNCTYTGNSSDYCNASDGTHNLKVLNCRPGTTSCYY